MRCGGVGVPFPNSCAAGWAGAGFFPWAIKGGGAGFSQGYSFGLRAEGTERSSSGGRRASGPRRRHGGARVRRAPAAPRSRRDASPRFSSSSGSGEAALAPVPGALGRHVARAPAAGGRARGRRACHLRGPGAGRSGHLRGGRRERGGLTAGWEGTGGQGGTERAGLESSRVAECS